MLLPAWLFPEGLAFLAPVFIQMCFLKGTDLSWVTRVILPEAAAFLNLHFLRT